LPGGAHKWRNISKPASSSFVVGREERRARGAEGAVYEEAAAGLEVEEVMVVKMVAVVEMVVVVLQ